MSFFTAVQRRRKSGYRFRCRRRTECAKWMMAYQTTALIDMARAIPMAVPIEEEEEVISGNNWKMIVPGNKHTATRRRARTFECTFAKGRESAPTA